MQIHSVVSHLAAVLLLWLSQNALAAEIVKVDKSTDTVYLNEFPSKEWKEKDGICIFQRRSLFACGTIQDLNGSKAVIHVTQKVSPLLEGDLVVFRRPERTPANASANAWPTTEVTMEEAANRPELDVALGLSAGTQYYYPSIEFKYAVGRQVALGLNPVIGMFGIGSLGATLFGAMGTITYFYSHYAYRGMNLEVGLGAMALSCGDAASPTVTTSGPIARVTMGWRGRIVSGSPFDIGANLGIQYLFLNSTPYNVNFKNLLPLFNLYVAYSF